MNSYHAPVPLLVLACLWLALTPSVAAPVIILDPGHGGHDAGASVGRVYEKHLNLDIAVRVARLLERAGLRVRLTRRSDTFVSLPGRAAIANRYPSAIFVSLHFNSTRDASKRGIETYYSNGSRSLALARSVQSNLVRSSGAADRGVKRRGFLVIRETRHPAVLVECGFLSNRAERQRCLSGSYRDRLARGIAHGIVRAAR